MVELWVVQMCMKKEKCCQATIIQRCIMFRCESSIEQKKKSKSAVSPTLSPGSIFFPSICGFFSQHPPLLLHPSICLRRQSANGPVIILLPLRKKTLHFFFFLTHKTIYIEWSVVPNDDTPDLLNAPLKPCTPAGTSCKPSTLGVLQ